MHVYSHIFPHTHTLSYTPFRSFDTLPPLAKHPKGVDSAEEEEEVAAVEETVVEGD